MPYPFTMSYAISIHHVICHIHSPRHMPGEFTMWLTYGLTPYHVPDVFMTQAFTMCLTFACHLYITDDSFPKIEEMSSIQKNSESFMYFTTGSYRTSSLLCGLTASLTFENFCQYKVKCERGSWCKCDRGGGGRSKISKVSKVSSLVNVRAKERVL